MTNYSLIEPDHLICCLNLQLHMNVPLMLLFQTVRSCLHAMPQCASVIGLLHLTNHALRLLTCS
jgi:hypothetical protein